MLTRASFFPQRRNSTTSALASKMFQAINDEDVDALKEILTAENPELDNLRTVNSNFFVCFTVFVLN